MLTEISRFPLSAFPRLPAYQARWSPVYWEPVMGSGERLTALIGAIGADGMVEVIQSIRPDTLTCMYGAQAKNVKGLLSLGGSSLRHHLESFREFSGWTAPVGGFSLGPVFEARSDTLAGVFRQAIQLSASLSALDDADEDEDSIEAPERDAGRQWGSQIRALVASQRPDLAVFFHCKLHFGPESRATRIGFLGLGMAAQFSLIRPNRVSDAIRDARARLWELQQVKAVRLDVADAGLLLCAPRPDDPLYSATQTQAARLAVNGLRREAGQGLWLETVTTTEEAAHLLISRLAA